MKSPSKLKFSILPRRSKNTRTFLWTQVNENSVMQSEYIPENALTGLSDSSSLTVGVSASISFEWPDTNVLKLRNLASLTDPPPSKSFATFTSCMFCSCWFPLIASPCVRPATVRKMIKLMSGLVRVTIFAVGASQPLRLVDGLCWYLRLSGSSAGAKQSWILGRDTGIQLVGRLWSRELQLTGFILRFPGLLE